MSTAVAKASERVARADEAMKEAVHGAAREARLAARRGRRAVEDAVDSTVVRIRRHPFRSGALLLGVGLAAGLCAGLFLRSRCSAGAVSLPDIGILDLSDEGEIC